MYIGLLPNVKPAQLNVEKGKSAEQAIISPRTVEDKEVTAKRKEEAAKKEVRQYSLNGEIEKEQIKIITEFFKTIEEVQTSEESNNHLGESPLPEAEKLAGQVRKVRDGLPLELNQDLSDNDISTILKASKKDLNIVREFTEAKVSELMEKEMSTTETYNAHEEFEVDLRKQNISPQLQDAILIIGKSRIVANIVYDAEKTAEKKEQAKNNVEPVFILEGQIIVNEKQKITDDIYRQLELVGLLENDNDYQAYIGLLLLVSISLYLIHYQLKTFGLLEVKDKPHILVYVMILLIMLGLMKGVSLFQKNEYTVVAYLIPSGLGTMLVYLLVHKRMVFITSALLSIWASILFNEGITGTFNFSMGIYVLLSSLAAPMFLTERKRSVMLLRTGAFLALFNIVLVLCLLLIKSGHYEWKEFGIYILTAAGSGMIASILTIGLVPYLEDGFGMISSLKLIDLASPNHPLLRKVLLEAPGTYHHSIMVANLSEVACEAIGADGLLARVGAYYHDIGKTFHPYYFIENQMGMENPHDSLTSQQSKDIIIAHVTDGVALLKKNHIPSEIVDIAAQHHGTTFLKYFYYKAKENDETVCEDDFRYPGPKAMSKEAAVVGIADSVEAAVRSLTPPTPEKIEALVKSIIKDRLQDGQFSECDLTFKELELVSRALCETLNGTFHSRIKYPEEKN
ncbi:HD family phosphohydrolase [Priestia taiwanensis]|uniref:HDIG domain-containing protein n=2 Tax=Priestia taiwanensis TaxID=1347902 RepID=A0A917ATZ4_9BACI|nr:HD family phosphohydrolase [Priestia taiwanensis]MBM7363749.1 putative nucleotidyltransferase with HDIG domain [Priestia taiwanensis]GGE74474.1 HDIG domain-containing protein [Priestia taiwanensis]